jgi:hypothetical protein
LTSDPAPPVSRSVRVKNGALISSEIVTRQQTCRPQGFGDHHQLAQTI